MGIIKVKRKITSSQIRISELKNFIGKNVTITVREIRSNRKKGLNHEAAGLLEKYANPALMPEEKEAWTIAVNEKRENYGR